jgi:hypothetical protein
MSILSTIGRLAQDYRRTRRRYHTERQIRSLPLEVQKDIGWPDIVRRDVVATRVPVGTWSGDR